MPIKLQSKYFFQLIFCLGFLFLESQAFSQDKPSNDQNSEVQKEATQEEHNTKDLETLLKKYNTNPEKVVEDSSKLNNLQDSSAQTEVRESDINEMRPDDVISSAKELAIKNVEKRQKEKEALLKQANSNLALSVKMALEPLQSLSEEELIKRLKEGIKEPQLKAQVEKYPKILIYAVKLVKDKDAVPSLVKIVEDRSRLIQFGSVMLFTIIFGFFLKKLFNREDRSFIGIVGFFLLRTFLLLALRIYVINYFFSTELAPALRILKTLF